MESVNVFLCIANCAGVAADAPEEFVLRYISQVVKLAVWEISSWDEFVADIAVELGCPTL